MVEILEAQMTDKQVYKRALEISIEDNMPFSLRRANYPKAKRAIVKILASYFIRKAKAELNGRKS